MSVSELVSFSAENEKYSFGRSLVVGPLVWNGLPLALRSPPMVFSQKFLQKLKITLFGRAGVGSASE